MNTIKILAVFVTFTGVTTALYIENGPKRAQEPCLDAAAGEWTVIQRREPNTGLQVDFYRTWDEYVAGFGLVNGSFWMGLDAIHDLTKNEDQELQVVLTNWEDKQRTANYQIFWIYGAEIQYQLAVGEYSGDAGDSLSEHDRMTFSTKDHGESNHCAKANEGAWWYTGCFTSHLNGVYYNGPDAGNTTGIQWMSWPGSKKLKHVEMKIRKKSNCTDNV